MAKRAEAKGITRELAEFVVSTSYGDIPSAVVEQAKGYFGDNIGVALTGSKELSTRMLADVLRVQGDKGEATVLGRDFKLGVLNATLANGYAAHALDYDDYQEQSYMHTSSPVVPAVLAVAETRGLSGRDVLLAYILGFDVGCRLGRACGKAIVESGLHPTGFAGPFAAAAAVGKLLGLDTAKMAQSFGIAASQAAGLTRNFGTMTKPFHASKAAMSGTLAALLAEKGFTASPNILDGENNFFAAFGSRQDPAKALDSLGQRYEITLNSIKAYACAGVRHPIVDAVIAIARQHDLQAEDVESIELQVWPDLLKLPQRPEPATGLDGKFSVQHCAAVALAERAAGEAQFTDSKVKEPKLVELRRKVRVVAKEEIKERQCTATVTTKRGQEFRHHVSAPKGSPGNPLSREELEAKFRTNASMVLAADKTERIIELMRRIDELPDIDQLVRLCVL